MPAGTANRNMTSLSAYGLLTLIGSGAAQAASYVDIYGTVVNPIQNTSGGNSTYSGSNLEPNANLYGAYLRYADLTAATLDSADLTGANLIYADLTGADLTYTTLHNADLTNADLSGASAAT